MWSTLDAEVLELVAPAQEAGEGAQDGLDYVCAVFCGVGLARYSRARGRVKERREQREGRREEGKGSAPE